MSQLEKNTANPNDSELVSGTKIPITELILKITHSGGDITISRILIGHDLPSSRIDEIREEMKKSASILLKDKLCQTNSINMDTLPDPSMKM